MAARRRTTAPSAAVAARDALPSAGQLVPSLRSVLVGLALAVLAVGGYLGARSTSVFAVRTIDVRGGTPELRAGVATALADERGTSLLGVDSAAVARRLGSIPEVRAFSMDRAFPHTLRVTLRRELPVLVVRRVPGSDAFLVAASGKVLKLLPHARRSHLPRLWVRNSVPLTAGAPLPAAFAPAAAAVAAARAGGLPGGVATVEVSPLELTLVLGGGLAVRLGDGGDLRLKIAIARRILRETGAATGGTGYLDVAVPGRPVLDQNPQVGGRG